MPVKKYFMHLGQKKAWRFLTVGRGGLHFRIKLFMIWLFLWFNYRPRKLFAPLIKIAWLFNFICFSVLKMLIKTNPERGLLSSKNSAWHILNSINVKINKIRDKTRGNGGTTAEIRAYTSPGWGAVLLPGAKAPCLVPPRLENALQQSWAVTCSLEHCQIHAHISQPLHSLQKSGSLSWNIPNHLEKDKT